MKFLRVISVCAILALVSACSSVGKTQIIQAKQMQIKTDAIASLSVNPPNSIPDDQKDTYMEVTQRLKGQLFGRLMSEGGFKQVVHENENADYKMEVNLLEANEVSQGARIFFGVLAGANALRVNVTLSDIASQKVITSFAVSGESASHPLSSESGMDDAIKEVVDEIILVLH